MENLTFAEIFAGIISLALLIVFLKLAANVGTIRKLLRYQVNTKIKESNADGNTWNCPRCDAKNNSSSTSVCSTCDYNLNE